MEIYTKLPIPILEKNYHTSAKIFRRKFVQYITITREIELLGMTKKCLHMGYLKIRVHGNDKVSEEKNPTRYPYTDFMHYLDYTL